AWHAMDDLSGIGEGVHAGDADFCCHESEKIGHLAMEVRWLERSGSIFSFQMAVSMHFMRFVPLKKGCLSTIWIALRRAIFFHMPSPTGRCFVELLFQRLQIGRKGDGDVDPFPGERMGEGQPLVVQGLTGERDAPPSV